jgi:hypothetical protein
MTVQIREPATMPAGWAARDWVHHGAGTAPARLAAIGADPRWKVRYATAWDGSRLTGVLPMCRPGVADIWDQDYDLRKLVGLPVPADARRWLLLGGCRDLAGGALTAAGLAAGAAAQTRTRLVAAATGAGRSEGLAVAAPYLRDAEVASFAGGTTFPAGETAVLTLPPATLPDHRDVADYLEMLPRKRRNKIRRDWREFTGSGLRSAPMGLAEAIETGSGLVAAVKQRHGIADHPRLAAMRLRRWHDLALGEYAAFAVHDRDHRLVAVCFTATVGPVLDVHEIGLTDDAGVRLPAYLEAGFYAPIRFALAHRCRSVEFGGEALATKRARGARTEPLWTVLFHD